MKHRAATIPTYRGLLLVGVQNKLGGGEGIEGLYGTLACGGMQKVLDCMAANCGLKSTSRLVDVGAGIGRWVLSCRAHTHCTYIALNHDTLSPRASNVSVPGLRSTFYGDPFPFPLRRAYAQQGCSICFNLYMSNSKSFAHAPELYMSGTCTLYKPPKTSAQK